MQFKVHFRTKQWGRRTKACGIVDGFTIIKTAIIKCGVANALDETGKIYYGAVETLDGTGGIKYKVLEHLM